MLEPSNIKKGLRVFHQENGLGEITLVNVIPGCCSVRFENGEIWGGLPIDKIAQELFGLDEWDDHQRRTEEERLGKQLWSKITGQLMVLCNDNISHNTLIYPGALREEDIALSNKWLGDSGDSMDSSTKRMLSARMAENALAQYWINQGEVIEDVSLQQLSHPESGDWKGFDFLVGGNPFDVKNARRSQQNPKAYVSHCVPSFKKNRSGKVVHIAGALSDWNSEERILAGISRVRFLGTVSESRINDLRGMLEQSHIFFTVKSIHSPAFLPLWIFDYHEKDYSDSRAIALAEIKQLLKSPDLKFVQQNSSLVPVLLAADTTDISAFMPPLASWQKIFIRHLQKQLHQYGMSLSVLFLTILEHFVGMLKEQDQHDYAPGGYLNLIMFSEGSETFPLSIFDPEEVIAALIGSLSVIWEKRNQALHEIRYFSLRELNILSGKKDEHAPWITVLAYCGGWIETLNKTKPCGKIPLVYGECLSCSECHRLICPNCAYCSKDCKERKNRQTSDHQTVIDS
jgi:hypothetical protein